MTAIKNQSYPIRERSSFSYEIEKITAWIKMPIGGDDSQEEHRMSGICGRFIRPVQKIELPAATDILDKKVKLSQNIPSRQFKDLGWRFS